MPLTQHAQLLHDCRESISDGNLEQCFKLLRRHLKPNASIANQVFLQSALFNSTARENNSSLLSRQDYHRENAQVIHAMLDLLPKIQEEDVLFDDGIHERILIFTFKENLAEWQRLFAKREFSHTRIVFYDDPIPEEYTTPVVVIFDDTGPAARPYMVQYATEMPQAHFLYFGERNPFTDSWKRNAQDAAIWDRTANANTLFTVYARLKELLEFRGIYGPPKPTN